MSVGQINIQGFGIITVPGLTENERINYAQSLLNNEGVFIPPPGKCGVSVITWDTIPEGQSVIAVGNIKDYVCFTVSDIRHIYNKNDQEFLLPHENNLNALIQEIQRRKI
jgi:hypothetical protein